MAINLLADMNTRQVSALLEKTKLAFLPVSPTEVHATHLPMSTDITIAVEACKRVAKKLCDNHGIECLIAPPVNYAPADETFVFPGTTTVSYEVCEKMVEEVTSCLVHWGFTHVILISNHGAAAATQALLDAADAINKKFPQAHVLMSNWIFGADVFPVMHCQHPEWDIHAGELETAMMMVTEPEHVDLEAMKELEPNWSAEHFEESLKAGMNFVELGARLAYLGDPRIASPETGEKIYDIKTDYVVKEALELLQI